MKEINIRCLPSLEMGKVEVSVFVNHGWPAWQRTTTCIGDAKAFLKDPIMAVSDSMKAAFAPDKRH